MKYSCWLAHRALFESEHGRLELRDAPIDRTVSTFKITCFEKILGSGCNHRLHPRKLFLLQDVHLFWQGSEALSESNL